MSFLCDDSKRTCEAWISAVFGAAIFFTCVIITFIALAIYSYTCGKKKRSDDDEPPRTGSTPLFCRKSQTRKDNTSREVKSYPMNNSYISTVSSNVNCSNNNFESFGCYFDNIIRRDKTAAFDSLKEEYMDWEPIDASVDEYGADEIVIIDQNYWRTYPRGSNPCNRLIFVTAKEAKSVARLEDYLSSDPNTDSELQVNYDSPKTVQMKPQRPSSNKNLESPKPHVAPVKETNTTANQPVNLSEPASQDPNNVNRGHPLLKQKRMTQSFSYETTKTITIKKNISFKGDSNLMSRKYRKFRKESSRNKMPEDHDFSNPGFNPDSSISSPSSEDRQLPELSPNGTSNGARRNDVIRKPTAGKKYQRTKYGNNVLQVSSPEADEFGELQKRMESPLSTASSFHDDAIDSLVYKELIEASKESEQKVKRRNRSGVKEHKRRKVLINPYPMRLDASDSGEM